MKLSLFRKVCLSVMGVGVVSSLVSVGTFATFTATTTNPGNTFAAGTLKISTSGASTLANGAGNSNISAAPNVATGSAGADLGSSTTCTTVIASSCGTLIATSSVTSEGLEPGQYVTGHITITNSGTLPAVMSVNLQQLFSTAATASCPSDIAGTQLANLAATNTALGTGNALGACAVLGKALNITVHDDHTTTFAHGQCLYGSNDHSGANVAASSAPDSNFIAVSGLCDTITANTTAGLKLAPAAAQTPSDEFGVPADATATNFGHFGLSGAGIGTPIYVSGDDTTHTATVNSGTVNYWAPGESHAFTITMAFPDQGSISTATITGGNSGVDTLTVGRDTVYQGGSVGFDLVWLATQ